MQLSTSLEYAIHGLIFLDHAAVEKPVLLERIATAVNVPKEYMRKIFQQLTRTHLVVARRGARGGYRLARPSDQLSLKDVVEAIEGTQPLYRCLSLRRRCSLDPGCPVRDAFNRAARKLSEELQSVSIRDLSRQILVDRLGEPSWLKVTA